MSDISYTIIEGEQKTDEWHKVREGVLTGSNAKKVKTAGNAYLYEMLAVMTTNRPNKEIHTEHIDRGNELEPAARDLYAKETKQKVEQVSFIKNGRYGISPDGIIFNKKREVTKLLEIKCPDSNSHIRYILENKLPAEHRDQIIHGFIVCDDIDEIDFVSYDPKFKFKPLHIIKVRRMDMLVDISLTRVQYEKFILKLDDSYAKLIL